ncbi:YrdB family protein [Agrilactobacillus fermenti]|uniref:YrdB family protein n=1 Tax=Agrilactobacillus fermenti TaxID=2586909 RepID=UPI001E5C21FB|nr:YrdB family protein [Agrilactobacillus fermenti]MCD2256384.1 YrdB family protein [Agrilactobacillus fermenti]
MKPINNAIRFLVEIATLILLVLSGLKFSQLPLKFLIGIVLPVGLVLFWARFMAPQSVLRFKSLGRVVTEASLFGGVAMLSFLNLAPTVGISYGLIAGVNAILDHRL